MMNGAQTSTIAATWSDRAYWVLGQRVAVLADAEQTGGSFALIEITTPPHADGPPPHFHKDCVETFHVQDGELEVLLADTWHRLRAGQSLIVPSGVVHTFRNPSGVEARTLSVFSPGQFARFFHDLGVPVHQAATAPPITAELVARVVTTAASYGMIIPPPPANSAK
jgi:quercetin dioxygenase-like cupin family protein